MADNKAKLTTGSKGDIDLDILSPTIGQDVIDVRTLGSKGFLPTTLVLLLLHPVNQKSPISMVSKASCCTVVFLSINSPLKPLISKFVISCYTVKHQLKNNMTYLKIR